MRYNSHEINNFLPLNLICTTVFESTTLQLLLLHSEHLFIHPKKYCYFFPRSVDPGHVYPVEIRAEIVQI